MSTQGPPPDDEGKILVTVTRSEGPAIVGVVDTASTVSPVKAEGLLAGSADMDGVGIVGVHGFSNGGAGVHGRSEAHDGVQGRTTHPQHAGVSAVNEGGGIALYGRGSPAGHFDGDVVVAGAMSVGGTLTMASGADIVLGDCAEHFPAHAPTEPGSVVVLDGVGGVVPCVEGYDPRVVGVVSGAGAYRPAVVLGRTSGDGSDVPVALLGTVSCMVDARSGAIRAGDLLTTSTTPGHAMRVADRSRALGAVIGKALEPLAAGTGRIDVLVTLR
jgi:hypothetical protein